jgi:heme A synthase
MLGCLSRRMHRTSLNKCSNVVSSMRVLSMILMATWSFVSACSASLTVPKWPLSP